MIEFFGEILGYIMRFCYSTFNNYGLAIIFFVLISKVILLPISIWVHKNGIKLVKMMPSINILKANYYGDKDRIAEEQAKIYKQEKYNPLASLIPLVIQIVLLMGIVEVIYNPLTYILRLSGDMVDSLIKITGEVTGVDISSSSVQLLVLSVVKNPSYVNEFLKLGSSYTVSEIKSLIESISNLNMEFLGLDLSWIPHEVKGITLIVPFLAAFTSWLQCYTQNKSSVLQSEQGKVNQYGTMIFSVCLSLYLGWFVPTGVALYWVCSILFAIVQMYILNAIINPKKYIDYVKLEESRKMLRDLENLGYNRKKWYKRDPHKKREKADYKRFFSIANKHLVFYSEKSGFYKYYENIIKELIKRSNITIHYVTSDPHDQIFEIAKSCSRIKPYYIGEKRLITLMMKMDADMVVMTMPDLNQFHYKRSYIRKDIEYVYIFHYPLSTHMVLRKGALDYYDTIFCVGEFQFDEIREAEKLYNLPPKNLIAVGYGQLEKLYDSYSRMEQVKREHRKVLIAPSWQTDNILDSCIDDLLKSLLGKGFQVVVRPHPEYVKRYGSRMDAIVKKYSEYQGGDLFFELDFTSNTSIFDSDVVITDWSGTAYEFSFVTKKPSLFINTPPKINNPDYTKISVVPLEISLRDKIGVQVDPQNFNNLAEIIERLIACKDDYSHEIAAIVEKYIANFGRSGEVGSKYIISRLVEKGSKKANVG